MRNILIVISGPSGVGKGTLVKLLLAEDESLTERDADYVQGFRTDLASEQDTISRDGYNAAAEDFNTRVLGGFPAGILGTLTFVQPAEIFH